MKIGAQLAALLLFLQVAQGQTLSGLSTGNYAGIAGLSFNPASIVDSRYKFDLNIASAQYFFTNNYLYAKPLLFARRYLWKSPYNGSFAAVQEDLLTPKVPAPEEKVYARQNTEFMLPLSFMLTTGKRSAIALSLRNRYDLSVKNLNPQTAAMFWSELRDPSILGATMNNDGFETQTMNWQEVGFTYGRVLMNANKHFIKFAVTGKWLAGNAAAYIQADELNVRFSTPTTLSMQSPAIQYARTSRADFQLFNRGAIVNDLEASNFGFDAGLVYEFRGRVANFRYTDEDYESRLRRDMNKYTFRVGITLNDVGVLNFNRLPLTRDHSATINNWNFGGVKANNISEWDTAYSKQVRYDPKSPDDFTVSLPTAVILNVDWHLFKGFYVNAAVQRRVPKLEKASTSRMFAGEWFAITPRFEGRQFGFYVPLLIRPDYTQIGATLRFGPVWIGSNNLLALVQNAQVPSADVHAGIRIPIGFGKPTKLLSSIESKSGLKISDDYERQMESVTTKTNALETRIAILEKMADSAYRTPPTLIVNNYVVDSAGKPKLQSQVSQTSRSSTRPPAATGYTKAQVDSINAENEKLRKEVEKRMKEDGVTPPREPKPTKNEKRAQKRQAQFEREQRQYQKALQDEMRRTRRTQAATGAAITGAIAANAVVTANNGSGGASPDTVVVRDTVVIEKVKTDTVYVKDSTQIPEKTVPGPTQKKKPELSPDKAAVPELRTARIFFASGSAAITSSYTNVLNKVAAWMLKNPDRRVLVTGVTDATGSASVNKALAQRRIDATIKALVSRGIDASRFEKDLNIATAKSANASASDRRVDISAIQ